MMKKHFIIWSAFFILRGDNSCHSKSLFSGIKLNNQIWVSSKLLQLLIAGAIGFALAFFISRSRQSRLEERIEYFDQGKIGMLNQKADRVWKSVHELLQKVS
jgi:hypothetical protein